MLLLLQGRLKTRFCEQENCFMFSYLILIAAPVFWHQRNSLNSRQSAGSKIKYKTKVQLFSFHGVSLTQLRLRGVHGYTLIRNSEHVREKELWHEGLVFITVTPHLQVGGLNLASSLSAWWDSSGYNSFPQV